MSIDASTLAAYRNQFRATKPDHPWLALDDQQFLHMIGAWTKDRQTGQAGLTLAGLLMFGQMRSILDAVPNYVVDYQEKSESSDRWIDRVTTDGTWSGNLYDFYRLVIRKLGSDLKVPFQLRGTDRIDETPVHEALREALVNTLVHADYTGRVPIQVIKSRESFVFRNPGTMRLPIEDVLIGGTSDCRNRNLQKMFQLVGLGEQAGSGVPKIYHSWTSQHWRAPDLVEQTDPELTMLAMRMVSLLPENTIRQLDERFGQPFRELSEVQRLALATVAIEGKVTNARLQSMTGHHPSDLGKELTSLVREGFLQSGGATRGTYYFFSEEPLEVPLLLPGFDALGTAQEASRHAEEGQAFSTMFGGGSEQTQSDSEQYTGGSELILENSEHSDALNATISSVRSKGRVPQQLMRQAISALCQDYQTLRDLSRLLGRSADTLRVHYLSPMLKEGQLELRYPSKPNHPDQGYRALPRM